MNCECECDNQNCVSPNSAWPCCQTSLRPVINHFLLSSLCPHSFIHSIHCLVNSSLSLCIQCCKVHSSSVSVNSFVVWGLALLFVIISANSFTPFRKHHSLFIVMWIMVFIHWCINIPDVQWSLAMMIVGFFMIHLLCVHY